MSLLGKQNFPRNLQLASYRPEELCHTLAVTPSWERVFLTGHSAFLNQTGVLLVKKNSKRIFGTQLTVLSKKFTFRPLNNNIFIRNLDCKQYVLTPHYGK